MHREKYSNILRRVVDPHKKVPDLHCEVQDLLLEVVDLKQEVPDLRSGVISHNLTPVSVYRYTASQGNKENSIRYDTIRYEMLFKRALESRHESA